jgi:alpha-L-arabinofuranosidase
MIGNNMHAELQRAERLRVLRLFAAVPLFLTAAQAITVSVDATHEIATINRANLMGVNIAIYNSPDDLKTAIAGPLGELDIGLVRIPGGSMSDRYYWNGNGVIKNGQADPNKYIHPFWQIDYSAYQPGFAFDYRDWSAIDYGVTHVDAKQMHELTRAHPTARNLVTVNAGSGTPEMAAEWVRWANIENKWDVKYWEIGNELNGEWEAGHIRPDGTKMTAENYAEIFTQFAKAMKAVDPTIKIGGPSCDVRHHEDYFEPLLRLAGEHVDFLTLHFYSLRDSLAPERELFQGLENLKPVTARLDELVKKYQPERFGEIEYSITEWNSKLPKDQDAYRLFNGLWFSAWIGEMAKLGIDSATVWDLFSNNDSNDHGMLVKQPGGYEPTGRYWAFWLWSHCMADKLIESSVDHDLLHVYATRDADNVYVMIMNESRTEAFPVELDLNGFEAKRGTVTTLSSREYFWNPVTKKAEWNSGPTSKPWTISNQVTVPPYCVKVFQVGTDRRAVCGAPGGHALPELNIVLPSSGISDLEVEGWVCAVNEGTTDPFAEDLGKVELSATGGAKITQIEPDLFGATAKFILKPNDPGPVTVTATCAGQTAQQVVEFRPVHFEEQIAWTFDEMPAHCESRLHPMIEEGRLKIRLHSESVQPPNNHIFAIKEYPRAIPKQRIGGVFFDLAVSNDFQPAETRLQVILQSHGAYWIPCGDLVLKPGSAQRVRMDIADKKFLQVMDQGFAVLFLLAANGDVSGTVVLDDFGFVLRPE